MKKRILSLLLAALMSVSALAACDNKEPVDDVENSDGQQVVQGDIPDVEPPVEPSEDVKENVNIVELNIQIPPEREPLNVETPEKVLKLTAVSEGDTDSKQMIINLEEFTVPVGATLEYDVYLETTAVGMGIFDMRVGNQYVSAMATDEAGIGNFIADDLSDFAYGRWYHRVFNLDNTEAQSSKMVRFSVGGLTNGSTNIAYFDNICVKDADGNVIYTLDEEFVSNYEIKQSKDLTCTFEVVDDPAPTVERLSANDYLYRYDSSEVLTGHDLIELTYNLDDIYSTPALYIGELDDSCFFGVRGYVLVAQHGYLYLYRCEETLTEIASQVITGLRTEKDFGLRIEVNGTEIRGYFIDDMEGIEPWPEFVVGLEDLTGKHWGYMDSLSRGVLFKTIEFSELKSVDLSSSYINPVHDGLADPDILYYDGMYYLYGTNGPGYRVYTSPDMVNWEFNGFCMETGAWGISDAYWAPDVEYYNGKFYMVCTVDRNLGLAVADSPLGPFEPIGELLLGFITFDGHIFIDDDGQAYLYYDSKYDGRQYGIYGAKIDLETATIDFSTETLCVFSEEVWESYGGNGDIGGNKVTEGPYMLKHDGHYYLTYSGGAYDYKKYAAGYAVSESPLGPFVKYEGNPIHVGNSTIHGTAHHSFVETPGGELFIVYHKHRTLTEVELRQPCIDRVRFAPTESGIDRLETYGPTTTPQPMPLG